MAKHLRYMGEFLSRAGIVWRVEILQEADQPFASVGMLNFEADEALVIEWAHTEKEAVICGSSATLRIESPSDRTYEDLYTIAPGRVRMDVYRGAALYWSGTLDPEFYEEPYERAARYPVSLTFSDFGVLNRLKYDLTGMRTISDIVSHCISRSGMNAPLNTGVISTMLSPDVPLRLSDLKVRSDNFYDEDGESMTLKEVLEGVLQPLALRIVQRAGCIYIYDFNALYTRSVSIPIVWAGDSQTLGTDRVYNNAKITWSPYAQSGDLSVQDCWTIPTDSNRIALNEIDGVTVGDATIFSYHYSSEIVDWMDASDSGFTIWISDKGENVDFGFATPARYYKIVPQYDGDESEGVAIHWPGIRGEYNDLTIIDYLRFRWANHGIQPVQLRGDTGKVGDIIFKSTPISLPHVNNPDDLILRISLNMLFDPRVNPFESAVNWRALPEMPTADWQAQWEAYCNFVYVPVAIKFRPNGSSDTYCWTNMDILRKDPTNSPVKALNSTYGQWVKDTSNALRQNVWGYLAYYDNDDRANKCGVGGWRKNRPAINPHTQSLSLLLSRAEDGQYIPFPNFGDEGGTLWVEVRTGWMLRRGGGGIDSGYEAWRFDDHLWQRFCWLLCRLPEIEILNNRQFDKAIDTDDVEYSAEINPYAKEDIEINTICGTCADGVPTARGGYFSSTDGCQITELTRAGRTSQVEDLLIGTLFSQFGDRRVQLSGEMKIATEGLSVYTEANQGDKKFIITSDVQDVISDISDATITELRPDEYEKR